MENTLGAFIEALEIFNKYIPNEKYVIQPSHDQINISIDEEIVSEEDIKKLDELGFSIDSDIGGFYYFT